MLRELVENAIGLVRERERKSVEKAAHERVEERLLDMLAPPPTVSYDAATPMAPKRPNATSERL